MSFAESVVRIKAIVDSIVPALDEHWPTYVGSPASGQDIPPRYIAVGYGGEDRPGITGVANRADSRNQLTTGHRWVVWCTASCSSGDVDPLARLNEVEDVFDAFEDALEADRTLGGLLQAGGLASMSAYEATMENDGQVATVFWTVEVWVRW